MKLQIGLGTCAILATVASLASAHPGHGVTDPSSGTHWMVEPLHLLPWVAAVVAIVTVAALRRRLMSTR